MSLSACLVPYQRASCSISTMGASMIAAALAWGFRLAATWIAGGIDSSYPSLGTIVGCHGSAAASRAFGGVGAMPGPPAPSDGRGRVLAAQPVPHPDGDQVQEHDEREHVRGGREHHRPDGGVG